MRFQQSRDFYIPKADNVTTQAFDDVAVIVYLQAITRRDGQVRFYGMGFAGKALKPTFNFSFHTEQRRASYIAEFIAGRRARIERKAQLAAERRNFQHTLQLGDVLRSVWGYDQTNVDYYQVVALKGQKQIVARRIHGISETTGWEQGKSAPDVGNFIEREPEKTYLVQDGNRIRIASYASASPVPRQEVGGLKVYESSHWTSYA